MQIKREKPNRVYSFVAQFPGENTACHKGPHRGSDQSIIRQKGDVGNKHLYRGFCGKESMRQGKQVWDSLTGISSSGSGADRLSLVVWHLALGQLKQVYGVLEYDHAI